MGITVLPSITTASVTRPENGSPDLLLKVASVFSSFTLSAVPAGRARLVCAKATPVINNKQNRPAKLFLILPPVYVLVSNFDCKTGSNRGQCPEATSEPAEARCRMLPTIRTGLSGQRPIAPPSDIIAIFGSHHGQALHRHRLSDWAVADIRQ